MNTILVVTLILGFAGSEINSFLIQQKNLDQGDIQKKSLLSGLDFEAFLRRKEQEKNEEKDGDFLAFLKRKEQEKNKQKDAVGGAGNGNFYSYLTGKEHEGNILKDAIGGIEGIIYCQGKLNLAMPDENFDECLRFMDDVKSIKPDLLQKVKNNLPITEIEITEFENSFGNFKNRSETVTIDIIHAINQANDINVKNGDIKETKPRTKRSTDPYSDGHIKKRDAVRDRIYLWMDRVVPYEIDEPLKLYESFIRKAMDEIEKLSCITFVKHTDQRNWIKIVKEDGCWSSVGREFWSRGYQKLSLGTNCLDKGIVMHEFMHALGFFHEQARSDRDKYIEIFWENIQRGQESNFERKQDHKIDLLGELYDYSSIMHYGKYSFAIDESLPTIDNYHNKTTELGQREHLSPTDIIQLNRLYDCKNKGKSWSNWSDFGPCNEECKKEKTRFCMSPQGYDKCTNPVSYDFLHYGVDIEEQKCTDAECYAPIDGNWNKWGSWGACSVTCDQGIQQRSRECTDPEPKYGGKPCVGYDTGSQPCKRRGCNEGIYDCTFDVDEDPYCAWHVEAKSSSKMTKWKRNSGSTPSMGTGPDRDHTSGSGYYLYMEASRIRPGYTASFVSPVISKEYQCMKFSYSMYGLRTGTLKVKVLDLVTKETKTVFVKSGDQLKDWHDAELQFNTANDFKVEIESVRGTTFQSDIAIDDIKIFKCYDRGGPVQPTQKTDFKKMYTKVGCFHDYGYINGRRVFPVLKNYRKMINWKDMISSFNRIVEECSKFAKSKGFQYFAIAFYGECYTGPDDRINYARDGESLDCHTGKPKTKTAGQPKSNVANDFLVGKDYSLMVYKIE